MPHRFARAVAQLKCDLAGDPHSAVRAAKAAMQRASWGRTGRIADATGLSQRTVETWGNPADPHRSPLQQLELVIQTALDSGASFCDALRESSEEIVRAIKALQDGRVTKAEADAIEREVAEAITALHRLSRESQAASRT